MTTDAAPRERDDVDSFDAEHMARMLLLRVGDPGDPAMGALVARHGAADIAEGIVRGVLGPPNIDTLRSRLPYGTETVEQAVQADIHAAQRSGARLVIPGDPEWPTQAEDLGPRAPLGLWVLGSANVRLLLVRSVSIVGARSATAYGEALARSVAATLADRGWLIVSGGAFGIDAAAHRGALDAGGASACVLAGGVDISYPRSHEALLSRMVSEGALISETAMGGSALRSRFLARNRLIAALTRGTVVVEAAVRSGSRTTAREAAAMVRPVMAFPGPVTSAMSAGCHDLLRDRQAILVTSAEDVEAMLAGFVELDESAPIAVPSAEDACPLAPDDPSSREGRVMAALSSRRAVELDRLVARTGLSPTDVVVALGLLEAQGLVRRAERGWCARAA